MTKQVKRFYFIFWDIQTRSGYLTRISLYVIPHHSPSPLLSGKEEAGALFHTGTHGGGNKKSKQHKQQGQHSQHHPHSQHNTLHHQLCQRWDGPLPYLHPDLPLGMDMVWDTFLTPTRLEVRAGRQEGRASRRTEALAQASQRHMGQGDPGITSQDTPHIPRECHPLFALRSHWTSSTLA